MSDYDRFITQLRDQVAKALDPNRSSVADEIDAMDWHFSELARLITDLVAQQDKALREVTADTARYRLNIIFQRAYRAKLISQGQRVTKSN